MKENFKPKLWVAGDLNGFFGLFSNVLTNFLAAIGLLLVIKMPNDMVFGKIVPAAALSIGVGNILLGYLAVKLSKKTSNAEVTAMPYGLSVPHYFAVAFGVIGVVYGTTQDWTSAWAAGLAWNFVQGIIMLIGAFVGPTISKYVPRSAMLGALAGLAITYIAANPAGEMFTQPYIGMTSFAIIMVGWIALKKMPFNIPAGAFAIMVGTIIAWLTGAMDGQAVSESFSTVGFNLPSLNVNLIFKGFELIGPFLPAAIPLAIYDFLESLDNLESAAVEGEHYPIAKAMSVPAVLTLVGAALGSPYPTIIYIGHPGWKATGARIGYSLATGVAILLLAFTGTMKIILAVVPLSALLPILIFIAMMIGTQAFSATPKRHYPALILSFIPLIAGFLVMKVSSALTAAGTSVSQVGVDALASNGIPIIGWQRLAGGDIVTGMLLASMIIFLIDRKFITAAVYAFITSVLAYFGLVHSTAIGVGAGLDVAIGYACFGLVLLAMNFYKKEENVVVSDEESADC
ncbi:MAG: hypothetical protein ACK5KR_01825 [Breznakia sp.]